jgi:hypothetical protein
MSTTQYTIVYGDARLIGRRDMGCFVSLVSREG